MKPEIEKQYSSIFPTLVQISEEINADLHEYLKDYSRIDRITTRAKSIERFLGKAEKKDDKGNIRYQDPISEIQDQIGARIITYYLEDVERIDQLISKYYRKIEEFENKPLSLKEFAYEAKHYILFIPEEIICKYSTIEHLPRYFELQLKTLFQHAWAEAEHDVNYKSDCELKSDDKKLLYFSAAQAWGADRAFNDIVKKYGM